MFHMYFERHVRVLTDMVPLIRVLCDWVIYIAYKMFKGSHVFHLLVLIILKDSWK
jgi:hypothetical protein